VTGTPATQALARTFSAGLEMSKKVDVHIPRNQRRGFTLIEKIADEALE